MEMPNLLLGGERWEALKGPKRREDPSSEAVQDSEPAPVLLAVFSKFGKPSL